MNVVDCVQMRSQMSILQTKNCTTGISILKHYRKCGAQIAQMVRVIVVNTSGWACGFECENKIYILPKIHMFLFVSVILNISPHTMCNPIVPKSWQRVKSCRKADNSSCFILFPKPQIEGLPSFKTKPSEFFSCLMSRKQIVEYNMPHIVLNYLFH